MNIIYLAPSTICLFSEGVITGFITEKPLQSASKNSVLKTILLSSASFSSVGLTEVRTISPKSYSKIPCITVSRSITLKSSGLDLLISTLLILVSLWVTRIGMRFSSTSFWIRSKITLCFCANSYSFSALSLRAGVA